MAARAMWNGNLKIGKLSIGIKLYAAVEDQKVHFHLLHEPDQERVKQHMVNPRTGQVREGKAIRRGYELEPGVFVLLTDDALRSLEPKPSRDIVLESFVPASAVGPSWYDRPYYLAPSGKSAEYFALARALAEEQRVGLARWVMRKRTYHGALGAHGDYLTLSSLRSADEVAEAPRLAPPARAADAKELGMARQLVEALSGDFDPTQFEDEHRERVRELIAAKARGKTVKLPARERARPARDLDRALEQSLKQLGKRAEHKERLSA